MKNLFIVAVLLLFMGTASACDGHFETRWQSVQVYGPHYENVLLYGRVVSVLVPARYERQLVQVWIPDRRGGGSFNLGVTWNWHTW